MSPVATGWGNTSSTPGNYTTIADASSDRAIDIGAKIVAAAKFLLFKGNVWLRQGNCLLAGDALLLTPCHPPAS